MGYSARYHATSLIAVFLAIAIGIAIGAALGGDTIDKTRADLERSLTGDLREAHERADELRGELSRAEQFSGQVYPVLVRDQLRGSRIGVVAFGDLPDEVFGAIGQALSATGGRIVAVGVLREPLDTRGLAEDLAATRLAQVHRDAEAQTAFGTGVGRQLVRGGNLLEVVRGSLFSRASGNFGKLDGVILVRAQPEEMGPIQQSTADRVEAGITVGVAATRVPAVGVESIDAEPSSISFFGANDLATVDNVDLVSGRLALVLALLGAEGDFGVKGSADRLLPDLVAPRGE